MNKKISNKISFISLIVVFGIAVYHSELMFALPEYKRFSMIYMPWFFMISGYFASRGLTKENRFKRLLKRVTTLLVPYVLWNLIQLFYGAACKGFNYKINWKKYFVGFFFSPGCVPTWYLFSVFVLLVVFFVIRPLIKTRRGVVVFLGLSFLISFALFAWFPAQLVETSAKLFNVDTPAGFFIKTFQYFPAFMMGAFAAEFPEGILEIKGKSYIAFMLAAIVTAVVICINTIPETLYIFLANIFNPLLWYAIPENWFPGKKYTYLFTEPSLFVCMSHIMLMEIWEMIFKFPGQIRYQLIIVPMAIISGYILFYLMKFLFPFGLNLLTGGRAVKSKKKA